jgi:hypothetical protein
VTGKRRREVALRSKTNSVSDLSDWKCARSEKRAGTIDAANRQVAVRRNACAFVKTTGEVGAADTCSGREVVEREWGGDVLVDQRANMSQLCG